MFAFVLDAEYTNIHLQPVGRLHAQIGAVVLVGALATPLFGVDAARARLDWEAAHVAFFRVEGVAFVCLGGLIVAALRPGRPIRSVE